jgi:hypothetical protein
VKELEKGVESAIKSDFSQIPVPPEGAEGEPAAEQDARATRDAERPQIALLEFEEPEKMLAEQSLKHPFRWNGEWLRKVKIRRLTFAEAMRVSETARNEGRELTNIDLFAAMTGLPAAVIRGMEAGDGDRVTNACLPFFPQSEGESDSP